MLRALELWKFLSRGCEMMRYTFMEKSLILSGSHLSRTTSLTEATGSRVTSAFMSGSHIAPLLPTMWP